MASAALTGGMRRVLSASGSPLNTILIGAGSEESIMRSEVGEQAAGIAEAAVAGVSEQLGVRGVSTEIHYMTFVKTGAGDEAQALFRGITPRALLVHAEVRLLDGRFPRPGQLMVGRLAHRKLKLPKEALRPGTKLLVDDGELTVSGVFAAPGTVMESELWAPLGDIRMLSQRDTVSCVVLRMERPEDYEEADLFTKQRLDLELSAIRESDYYGRLSPARCSAG
jgi:putative ABC transport system permease protein